jgi:hypothetical protein
MTARVEHRAALVSVQTIGPLSLKNVLMTSGKPVRAKKDDMSS